MKFYGGGGWGCKRNKWLDFGSDLDHGPALVEVCALWVLGLWWLSMYIWYLVAKASEWIQRLYFFYLNSLTNKKDSSESQWPCGLGRDLRCQSASSYETCSKWSSSGNFIGVIFVIWSKFLFVNLASIWEKNQKTIFVEVCGKCRIPNACTRCSIWCSSVCIVRTSTHAVWCPWPVHVKDGILQLFHQFKVWSQSQGWRDNMKIATSLCLNIC